VLDVARSVVVVVDQLLRQDEVVRLDVVEDGDDGLARLVKRGELAEAVVGDAVVPGEDGHSEDAPSAARGEGGGGGTGRATAAVAVQVKGGGSAGRLQRWRLLHGGIGRWRCGSRAHTVEGEAYRSRP
jgi:hypothetical protein